MTTPEAKQLIEAAIPKASLAHWADIGCGSGTFTYAVAELLGKGSRISAVDKLNQHLAVERAEVKITFSQLDIEYANLPVGQYDGIIMANTLHYIKDQARFLEKLRSWLKTPGQLVLVEYDTERSNQWVPYPVTFEKAQLLLTDAGFENIVKIGERPSLYRTDNMFACVARC